MYTVCISFVDTYGDQKTTLGLICYWPGTGGRFRTLITSVAMKIRSLLRSVCGATIPFSRIWITAAFSVGDIFEVVMATILY